MLLLNPPVPVVRLIDRLCAPPTAFADNAPPFALDGFAPPGGVLTLSGPPLKLSIRIAADAGAHMKHHKPSAASAKLNRLRKLTTLLPTLARAFASPPYFDADRPPIIRRAADKTPTRAVLQ